VPEHLRSGLQFVFVDQMDQVLSAALDSRATSPANEPKKQIRVGRIKIEKEITASA
jgi:hypothetical protein